MGGFLCKYGCALMGAAAIVGLTGCRAPLMLAPRSIAQAAVEPRTGSSVGVPFETDSHADALAPADPGEPSDLAESPVESPVEPRTKRTGVPRRPERAPREESAPDEIVSLIADGGLELRFDGQGNVWLPGLGVDWTSVDRMNLGMPSVVSLGSRWGMAISSGQDRLEECQPTLALSDHRPGFSDTFVFLTATYRLTPWAHLLGSVAGLRIQDQALSEAVDDAQFSSATVGVYFHF